MARAATAFTRAVLAGLVASAVLAGCHADPPDRQAHADQLTGRIRAMPAVVSATDAVADSFDEGRVYAEVHVQVADGATGDQVAAIVSTYLDDLRAVDYSGYRTEFDLTRGASTFVVDNGRRKITNDQQIVQQVRDWTALLTRFPGGAVTLHAAVTHPPAPTPGIVVDQPAAGRVELPDPATYRDVATAFAALAATAPGLASGHWIVGAGKEFPAEITTTGRWPTEAELQAWDAINADQAIPHADSMTINGPITGPLWVGEVTQSHDSGVALQLARRHLPVVAALPAPVLYTATDSWSGHLDATGQATSSVVVTTGGCSKRTYSPKADEQALINSYETCRR